MRIFLYLLVCLECEISINSINSEMRAKYVDKINKTEHVSLIRSEKFATMATRTRQEYLKDLATNYTTTTVVDTGQKFCTLRF